jgi:hypothetical protein
VKFCLLLTPNGAADAVQAFIGFLAPIVDRGQQKTHAAQKTHRKGDGPYLAQPAHVSGGCPSLSGQRTRGAISK